MSYISFHLEPYLSPFYEVFTPTSVSTIFIEFDLNAPLFISKDAVGVAQVQSFLAASCCWRHFMKVHNPQKQKQKALH